MVASTQQRRHRRRPLRTALLLTVVVTLGLLLVLLPVGAAASGRTEGQPPEKIEMEEEAGDEKEDNVLAQASNKAGAATANGGKQEKEEDVSKKEKEGKRQPSPPRPLPDPEKAEEGEDKAQQHQQDQAKQRQGKPWWTSGSNQTSSSSEIPPAQPWQEDCAGEWGYEGYNEKAKKGHGPDKDKEAEEFQKRCQQYTKSVAYVNGFEHANPNAAFKVGVNNMSDWTPEEQQKLYGVKDIYADEAQTLNMDDTATVEGLITGTVTYEEVFFSSSSTDASIPARRQVLARTLPTYTTNPLNSGNEVTLPKSLDYRFKDSNPYGIVAVTPIKQQGKCGSCWAFTTAALIEGQVALQKNGSTKNLSPQHLIDCDTDSSGCNGGRVNEALNFTRVHGIRTLGSYPYREAQGVCQGHSPTFAYAYGPTYMPGCDERQLMKALYYFGPVAVNLKANCPAFMSYASGIFTPDQDCLPSTSSFLDQKSCGTEVDHAMVLVGWGTDATSKMDYWVVRNTWGTSWGEGGYMRIQRNGARMCGTSCLAAFGVAAVQGFSLDPLSEWTDDDVLEEGGDGSVVDKIKEIVDGVGDALIRAGDAIKKAAEKTSEALKNVDVRILAVSGFFACLLFLAFSYWCCCLRRRRRSRLVQLELERERARWV